MIKLLTNHSITSIKNKFTLIYILNCTDILFTYTLLKTGGFYEANALMQFIVTSPLLSILVKVLIPALLLYLLFSYLDSGSSPSLKFCNILVVLILFMYMAINVLHLFYSSTLILTL